MKNSTEKVLMNISDLILFIRKIIRFLASLISIAILTLTLTINKLFLLIDKIPEFTEEEKNTFVILLVISIIYLSGELSAKLIKERE